VKGADGKWKSELTGGSGDWDFGQDGNLIGEFRLIERLYKQMAKEQSSNAFTCNVREEPYLQCLDLTSHNNGAVVIELQESGYVDITAGIGSYGGSIFGQSVECDGKVVGDGILNVYDLALLLKYMVGGFEDQLPQDPSAITTGVQGRTDLHRRCDDGLSLWDHKAAYEANPPYSNCWLNGEEDLAAGGLRVGGARRLVERMPVSSLESPMVVHTRLWLAVEGKGAWYQVTLRDVHKSAELQIQNIRWPDRGPREAELQDDVYPWDGVEPASPEEVRVLYAHHCEYAGDCTGHCSVITPVLSNRLLIVEDTLAYTLGATNGETVLCAVDFYIWVPANKSRDPRDHVPEPCVTFGTAQPARATSRTSVTCGSGALSTTGGESADEGSGSPMLPPVGGPSPPLADEWALASPPAAQPFPVNASALAPPPPSNMEGGGLGQLLVVFLILLLSCCCCCLAVAAVAGYRRRNMSLTRVDPGAVGKRDRLGSPVLAEPTAAVGFHAVPPPFLRKRSSSTIFLQL